MKKLRFRPVLRFVTCLISGRKGTRAQVPYSPCRDPAADTAWPDH